MDGKKILYLHRVIMGFPEGNIDHINRNTLDNRRENLRVVDQAHNMHNSILLRKGNTSGYRGIYWIKPLKKWSARVRIDGKIKQLGCFSDPVEAALVRDSAVRREYGELATVNFK